MFYFRIYFYDTVYIVCHCFLFYFYFSLVVFVYLFLVLSLSTRGERPRISLYSCKVTIKIIHAFIHSFISRRGRDTCWRFVFGLDFRGGGWIFLCLLILAIILWVIVTVGPQPTVLIASLVKSGMTKVG